MIAIKAQAHARSATTYFTWIPQAIVWAMELVTSITVDTVS